MIPTPKRINNKVDGDFYPLQKEELIALRRSKIINNTAFVHFALRYENPFCDRPIKIHPKEFAFSWGIPESSVYEAIAKLKNKGIIKTRSGQISIEWATHSQQEPHSDNPESLRDPRIDSEIPELITESQNKLQDPRIDSEIPEKQPPKPALNNDSSSSQTIQINQTNQTYQTRGGGEKNLDPDHQLDNGTNAIEQNYESQQGDSSQGSGDEKTSCAVVYETTNNATVSPKKKSPDIPQELVNKLEELNIPLDKKVRAVIAKHHISQAYGALRHVENTWETINNPRSVFLYQLPKQRIEKGPKPLSEEFLQWYDLAIADGLVVNYPAQHLPKNFRGEPKVKLKIDPYWLEDWEKVRDNPEDYRQKLDPATAKELMAKVGEVFKRPPQPRQESTLNDQLNDPILGPEVYQQIKRTHNIEFTEEGRPYSATKIVDIKYDENGIPAGEVKSW